MSLEVTVRSEGFGDVTRPAVLGMHLYGSKVVDVVCTHTNTNTTEERQ
jgi:hypothetical protein